MVTLRIPRRTRIHPEAVEVSGIGGASPDLSIQMAGQAELGYFRREGVSAPLLGGLVSDVSGAIRNVFGLLCQIDNTFGGSTLTIENPGVGRVITTLGVQARFYKTGGLGGLGERTMTLKRLTANDAEVASFTLDMDDIDPTGSDRQRGFNTPTLAVSSTNGGAFENTKVQIGFDVAPSSDEIQYCFYSYAVLDVST